MNNITDYLEWTTSLVYADGVTQSPMIEAHREIAKVIRASGFSFHEVVVILAGVGSTYCSDVSDVKFAIELFDDTISGIVAFGENDVDDSDGDAEELRW